MKGEASAKPPKNATLVATTNAFAGPRLIKSMLNFWLSATAVALVSNRKPNHCAWLVPAGTGSNCRLTTGLVPKMEAPAGLGFNWKWYGRLVPTIRLITWTLSGYLIRA